MLSPRSHLLTGWSWTEVRDYLSRETRLIVPVGACDQYGPHLPIGSGTLVAEALATDLSEEFGILRAPTLPYGVNLPSERHFHGASGLREKTLHATVNDLLATWEDHGFDEFILITSHGYEPHVEAIATVTGTCARVRAVEITSIGLSHLLEGAAGADHGGEALTSLLLHLHPDKVKLEAARDYVATGRRGSPLPSLARVPAASVGSIGLPSLATAEKGRQIYQHILERVRTKIFLRAEDDE